MKTRYSVREYEGDTPCIPPLAMADLLIRINNKQPKYKLGNLSPNNSFGIGALADPARGCQSLNPMGAAWDNYYYPPKHN